MSDNFDFDKELKQASNWWENFKKNPCGFSEENIKEIQPEGRCYWFIFKSEKLGLEETSYGFCRKGDNLIGFIKDKVQDSVDFWKSKGFECSDLVVEVREDDCE